MKYHNREDEEEQKNFIYNNADYHKFFLEARKLDFKVSQRVDGRPMIRVDKWVLPTMRMYFSVPIEVQALTKGRQEFIVFPKKS